MPRETTHSADGSDVRTDICWSREAEYVQLATLRERLDRQTGTATYPPGEEGLYATLDRVAINRLIRTLRRARDQAFGRDE